MKDINLINLLYEQTLKDEEESARKRKPRHYPSSACAMVKGKFQGHCRRATWFDWHGFEKTNPMDAPALFKVNVGNLIHDSLSATLERGLKRLGYEQEGLGAEVEFHWTPPGLKFEVSGRMDHVFVGPDAKRLKAEWKSTYGRGADFIKRDGPKVEHLIQCRLYLDQPEYPTEDIFLVYAARDSGYMFGYLIEREDGGLLVRHQGSSKVEVVPVDLQGFLDATAYLEEFIVSGDVPPRDYEDSDWQCRYCSFARMCGDTK